VPHRNIALRGRPRSSVGSVSPALVPLRTGKGRGGLNACRAIVFSAEREATAAGKNIGLPCSGSAAAGRGLTLRSRRGPTAGHQARATGAVYIFCGPGLAPRRRSRLTSNVRQTQSRGRGFAGSSGRGCSQNRFAAAGYCASKQPDSVRPGLSDDLGKEAPRQREAGEWGAAAHTSGR